MEKGVRGQEILEGLLLTCRCKCLLKTEVSRGGTGREDLERNMEAAEKDVSTLSKLSVCVLKMARMKN